MKWRKCKVCHQYCIVDGLHFPRRGARWSHICFKCIDGIVETEYQHYIASKNDEPLLYKRRVNQQTLRELQNIHTESQGSNCGKTFTQEDWRRALEYFNWSCAICGRKQGSGRVIAQDHWIPVTKGGEYIPSNIVPLCHGFDGCNNKKNNRDAAKWLGETFGPQKAGDIQKRITDYFQWVACQSSG